MTRLMFSRDSAVTLVHDLLLKAEKAKEPFILSKKMETVNLYKLAQLISNDIEHIGLRPGEKLFEELLLDGKFEATENKLIMRAEEKMLSLTKLKPKLLTLEKVAKNEDMNTLFSLLKELVPEFNSTKIK